MDTLTERVLRSLPVSQFTVSDVATLFPGSENSRYGLVKRAIASGDVIQVRRGLYCLGAELQKRLNPYALAQQIYGPSYISLESALSWHGWIPEAVYTVTSAAFKKSFALETPIGSFSYTRLPQQVFYTAVSRETDESGGAYLIATPLKALCDYVYVHRLNWTGVDPLRESLRVAAENLERLPGEAFDLLLSNYRNSRVKRFLVGLRKDLAL